MIEEKSLAAAMECILEAAGNIILDTKSAEGVENAVNVGRIMGVARCVFLACRTEPVSLDITPRGVRFSTVETEVGPRRVFKDENGHCVMECAAKEAAL